MQNQWQEPAGSLHDSKISSDAIPGHKLAPSQVKKNDCAKSKVKSKGREPREVEVKICI